MNPNYFKAELFGDEVWFIMDDSYREFVPEDAITYTLVEAQKLASRPVGTIRLVHEVKKYGGRVE